MKAFGTGASGSREASARIPKSLAKAGGQGSPGRDEIRREDASHSQGPRRSAKSTAKAPTANSRQRERRIAVLEAQIRKLADELKALKADDDQD